MQKGDMKTEAEAILRSHPDKVPVLIKKYPKSKLKELDKCKYLFDKKADIFVVNDIIQRRLKLSKAEALYLFIGENLLKPFEKVGHVYEEFKDDDGFLRIYYYEYGTFGLTMIH